MGPHLIRDLIGRLAASPITELEIEQDGWRIRISRNASDAASAAAHRPVDATPRRSPRSDVSGTKVDEPIRFITSPGFGVFSRSPSPDAPAYVVSGQEVKPGQQMGVLEAMKVFSPVESTLAGRITDILVDDGAEVSAEQPLFAVSVP